MYRLRVKKKNEFNLVNLSNYIQGAILSESEWRISKSCLYLQNKLCHT